MNEADEARELRQTGGDSVMKKEAIRHEIKTIRLIAAQQGRIRQQEGGDNNERNTNRSD